MRQRKEKKRKGQRTFKKQAKQIWSVFYTVLCAVVILAAGYTGIVVSGKEILKNPSEPQSIKLSGNISKLFYSRLEDNIQLFPWNYYPAQNTIDSQQLEESSVFSGYDPFIEVDVFYTLIGLASGVDTQEVIQWYDKQNKTIFSSMVYGIVDSSGMAICFYQDELQLGGKMYEVKLACNEYTILSFSCIRSVEDGVKDTAVWEENKDEFLRWMEEEPEKINGLFLVMDDAFELNIKYGQGGWTSYLGLFIDDITRERASGNVSEGSSIVIQEDMELFDERNAFGEADQSPSLQVVELKDCILLLRENEIPIGIYYDVMRQKIAGFHYFYQ